MNKKNFWAFTFALGLVMTFVGLIATDYAEKKAAWVAWDAIGYSGIVIAFASIIYGASKSGKKK